MLNEEAIFDEIFPFLTEKNKRDLNIVIRMKDRQTKSEI